MSTKSGFWRFLFAMMFLFFLTDCGGGGGGDSEDQPPPGAPAGATVLKLQPNTTYYFAVDAYNGLHDGLSGPCSTEVSAVTPPSGIVYLLWTPMTDPTIIAYDVHYGKQPSPGPPGDCTYTNSIQVAAHP